MHYDINFVGGSWANLAHQEFRARPLLYGHNPPYPGYTGDVVANEIRGFRCLRRGQKL